MHGLHHRKPVEERRKGLCNSAAAQAGEKWEGQIFIRGPATMQRYHPTALLLPQAVRIVLDERLTMEIQQGKGEAESSLSFLWPIKGMASRQSETQR